MLIFLDREGRRGREPDDPAINTQTALASAPGTPSCAVTPSRSGSRCPAAPVRWCRGVTCRPGTLPTTAFTLAINLRSGGADVLTDC